MEAREIVFSNQRENGVFAGEPNTGEWGSKPWSRPIEPGQMRLLGLLPGGWTRMSPHLCQRCTLCFCAVVPPQAGGVWVSSLASLHLYLLRGREGRN